jgi:phospholipase C
MASSPIKHVVVVMLENNSMDRMFGMRLKTALGHFNLDEKNKKHYSTPGAENVPFCGPAHGLESMLEKVYGVGHKNLDNATMSGFYEFEEKQGNRDGCGVMDVFNETSLTVSNFLADQGVLFDRFFCSVPGPTWPNRK